MELQHLQNFLIILEQGSISNAANLIRIAQPALSRQLRALEDELGAQLLLRHRRGVSATPAGEVLAEHAREILGRVQAAQDAVSLTTGTPHGSLSVGVTASIAGLIIPSLAMSARRSMQNVKLRLAESDSAGLRQRLAAGDLDLVVMNARDPIQSIETRPLLTEPVVFVGAAGTFVHGEAVTIWEVARHQSILTPPSGRLRLLYEEAVASAGADPTSFLEVDSFSALAQLLAAGAGVSLLPYSTAHAGVAAGHLSWAPLGPRPLFRKLVLAKRQDRVETPSWKFISEILYSIVDEKKSIYRWIVAPKSKIVMG